MDQAAQQEGLAGCAGPTAAMRMQHPLGGLPHALRHQRRHHPHDRQRRAAEELLGSLRAELDEPLTPVVRRQIVEALVEKIEVGKVERWGVPQSAVTVTCFSDGVA